MPSASEMLTAVLDKVLLAPMSSMSPHKYDGVVLPGAVIIGHGERCFIALSAPSGVQYNSFEWIVKI